MTEKINMKISSINGEVLLAAADSSIVGKVIREGKLHLDIRADFYGDIRVNDDTFVSSLEICTIANLVGKHVVEKAIEEGYIDPDNVLSIDNIPHAQFTRMLES
ncbi:DUF424 family protein [Oxyplasma meridianum]|uniref:DUF424 family protein n=1 Tax=Oxyplasma meridianum TaxID=3073602 RepID=A0AAX4NGC1_9ARCH